MTVRATVVADTEMNSARITTIEIYCPRVILAEINTHRILTKSVASSRAIPVKKRIANVKADPYMPVFGKNKKGMQQDETLDTVTQAQAGQIWCGAMTACVHAAEALESLEAHKQHANRVIETFCHIPAVITATEWDNFWLLRDSSQAQPEFEALAKAMRKALDESRPSAGGVHLPYVIPSEGIASTELAKLMNIGRACEISSARCARVSYRTVEGLVSTYDADATLCKRLLEQFHMSPFDHPAFADTAIPTLLDGHGWHKWARPRDHRQYWGWIPYRVQVEQELGIKGRRDSFANFKL